MEIKNGTIDRVSNRGNLVIDNGHPHGVIARADDLRDLGVEGFSVHRAELPDDPRQLVGAEVVYVENVENVRGSHHITRVARPWSFAD